MSAISEKLCGLEFSISADSFFQVNSRQAEVLYGMIQKAAGTAVAVPYIASDLAVVHYRVDGTKSQTVAEPSLINLYA